MKLMKALTFGLYRSDTSSSTDKHMSSAPSPNGSRSSSPSRRRARLSMMKRGNTDDSGHDVDSPRAASHPRFSKFFPHKSHDPKQSPHANHDYEHHHDAEHTPVVDGLDFTIRDRDLELHRARTAGSNQMSTFTSHNEPVPSWTDDMPRINHPLHFDSSIGTGFGPSP